VPASTLPTAAAARNRLRDLGVRATVHVGARLPSALSSHCCRQLRYSCLPTRLLSLAVQSVGAEVIRNNTNPSLQHQPLAVTRSAVILSNVGCKECTRNAVKRRLRPVWPLRRPGLD
jgi:hypothetical protein